MQLTYRRQMRMPIYNLPGFNNGKPDFEAMSRDWAKNNQIRVSPQGQMYSTVYDPEWQTTGNKAQSTLQGQAGNIFQSGIAFTGDMINAFGPTKGVNELMSDAGTYNAIGNGFGYQAYNQVNSSDQLSELGKQNTNNTLKTAGSGAALGAAVGSVVPGVGTVLGGLIGGIGGLIGGLFGGASRRRKLRRRIFDAKQTINRYNNFAQSSSQSDYLDQSYNLDHENTNDDMLVAKRGKDANQKVSYTSVGKQNVQPNARVAAAESILDNINDVNNATGQVVKTGKLGQDTNYANLNNDTVVLGQDKDWRNGQTFRDQALPYTEALEKINSKYEQRTNSKLNKLRGKLGQDSDNIQQQEINKLKAPIVNKLKDLSDQQQLQHSVTNNMQTYNTYKFGKDRLPGFKNGTISKMDWLSNAIPMGAGMLTSLGQWLEAKRQGIHTPDIYAANPYENAALTQLASLHSNPYPILQQINNANRRNLYAINRAGGLSGAQKYLANVASGLVSTEQIADALFKSQEQNNQYKTAYANALLQSGAQNASRRQQANQYNTEYAASAHAARLQGQQMGLRNLMDYMQQYSANEYKRKTGNDMLDIYQQQVDLDKDKLNRMFPKEKSIYYPKVSYSTPIVYNTKPFYTYTPVTQEDYLNSLIPWRNYKNQ